MFSTASDNQTSVEIHVLQGEREMARDNRTLGNFHLIGLPPGAARGAAGRGHVRHRRQRHPERLGQGPGHRQEPGDHDHRRPRASARTRSRRWCGTPQSHAEEDKRRRELIDAKNQADSLAYNVEKLVKENREKLGEAEAKSLETAVAEARKIAEGDDAAAIKAATEKLTGLSHKLAETLYKQTAEAGAGGPGGDAGASAGAPAQGDVVDAEYTVKN